MLAPEENGILLFAWLHHLLLVCSISWIPWTTWIQTVVADDFQVTAAMILLINAMAFVEMGSILTFSIMVRSLTYQDVVVTLGEVSCCCWHNWNWNPPPATKST